MFPVGSVERVPELQCVHPLPAVEEAVAAGRRILTSEIGDGRGYARVLTELPVPIDVGSPQTRLMHEIRLVSGIQISEILID